MMSGVDPDVVSGLKNPSSPQVRGKTVKMLAVLQCIRCGVNRNRTIVTPAQAGVQQKKPWIPACAEPAPVKTGERRRGKQERC